MWTFSWTKRRLRKFKIQISNEQNVKDITSYLSECRVLNLERSDTKNKEMSSEKHIRAIYSPLNPTFM